MDKDIALRLALEALESFVKDDLTPEHYMKTIAAVKQALAEQPAPVQLTDEEIVWLVPGLLDCLCDPYDYNKSGNSTASIRKDMVRLARAIEAKLKEKNT